MHLEQKLLNSSHSIHIHSSIIIVSITNELLIKIKVGTQ